MVKMNGCAAIDSARPFRFLVDKAAVAADFHLRKWRLLTWVSNGYGGKVKKTYYKYPRRYRPRKNSIVGFLYALMKGK